MQQPFAFKSQKYESDADIACEPDKTGLHVEELFIFLLHLY